VVSYQLVSEYGQGQFSFHIKPLPQFGRETFLPKRFPKIEQIQANHLERRQNKRASAA